MPTPAQDTFLSSTSKSSTMSLVSSVPLRLPTAHTSLVLLQRSRHTTPPLPPLSSDTRFRRNSPVFRSQILTVPSSEEVMTNFLLNCRHVTALWCLLGPETRRATHGGGEEKAGGILWVTKFTAMLGHQLKPHECVLLVFKPPSKRLQENVTREIRAEKSWDWREHRNKTCNAWSG